jgi:predicted  nucleic acid-binding Zn-ribbon protein
LQTSSIDREKIHTNLAAIRQEQEAQRQEAARSEAMGKDLSSGLASARQQIDKIHKDLQDKRTGRKKLSLDVAALNQEMEIRRLAADKSAGDRKRLASSLDSTRGQIEALQEAMDGFQESNEKHVAELSKIYSELESQHKTAGHLESNQLSMVSAMSSVHEQIGKLNSELQSFRKSREDLVAQMDSIHRKVDARLKADASIKPVLDHPAVKRESTPTQGKKETVPGKTEKTGKELYEYSDLTTASKNSARYPSNESQIFQNETVAIERVLRSWADAWSHQDVAGYLSHYSPVFRANSGADFKKWREQRKKRIEKPEFIEIKVDNLKIEVKKDAIRAKATFHQQYRSNSYADIVVKTLDLILQDNGWKIIKETSKPVK